MFGNLTKPRLLRNTDRMRPNPIDPVGVREDIGHVTYLTFFFSSLKKQQFLISFSLLRIPDRITKQENFYMIRRREAWQTMKTDN